MLNLRSYKKKFEKQKNNQRDLVDFNRSMFGKSHGSMDPQLLRDTQIAFVADCESKMFE